MGHYHFFEMDQSHVGAVINHYRSTGANDHILCALSGQMTPNQKEKARRQAKLDTKQYIDILTTRILHLQMNILINSTRRQES